MKFRLIHTEVLDLKLKKLMPEKEQVVTARPKKDTKYKVDLNVFPDVDRPRLFGVVFFVRINQFDGFGMSLEYVAWFETESDLSEETMNSPFVRVNAPAVAFPFVRAYISLLTLNSGYRPVIIPTINFVEIYKSSKLANAQNKISL